MNSENAMIDATVNATAIVTDTKKMQKQKEKEAKILAKQKEKEAKILAKQKEKEAKLLAKQQEKEAKLLAKQKEKEAKLLAKQQEKEAIKAAKLLAKQQEKEAIKAAKLLEKQKEKESKLLAKQQEKEAKKEAKKAAKKKTNNKNKKTNNEINAQPQPEPENIPINLPTNENKNENKNYIEILRNLTPEEYDKFHDILLSYHYDHNTCKHLQHYFDPIIQELSTIDVQFKIDYINDCPDESDENPLDEDDIILWFSIQTVCWDILLNKNTIQIHYNGLNSKTKRVTTIKNKIDKILSQYFKVDWNLSDKTVHLEVPMDILEKDKKEFENIVESILNYISRDKTPSSWNFRRIF